MDISVVNEGGWYTFTIHNVNLVEWVDLNLDIPVYLRMSKNVFCGDEEEYVNNTLVSILQAGYSAELDNNPFTLN